MHREPALQLAEIIDTAAVQALLEDFYDLTRIPVSLIDLEGRVLVGVGWQRICLNYHRAHPQSCRNCLESDIELTDGLKPGEYRMYQCKNNMRDVATPIVVGGRKVGNLLSGQFFFEDEPVDEDLFRCQAVLYGFDKTEYLSALREVPRLSRTAVGSGMAFVIKLAQMLSQMSYRNLQLAASLEQRQALADSLAESAALLKSSEAIAHVGSWTLDVAENRLSWSDEVYRIFGLPPQEFGATYEAFLNAVHPEDRAAVHNAYSDSILAGQSSYEIQHRVVRKGTGEIRWVREKCTHITDWDGRVVRSIGMVQDITDSKQAHDTLERANKELIEANRSWEEFAFAVSHDLQEPLRTINIYAQMLLRRPELRNDQEALRCAEFIGTGVRRLEALLRDLLSYTCATSDRQEHRLTADLNQCFDDARDSLQAQIRDAGAVVRRGHLPVVHGAERQLTQVLQNLLSNAVKYRRDGVPPEVTVSALITGPECTVTVRDNGIGFDPSYAERIFGLFKRLHRSDYPGTGVGLAICRRIVEGCGGRIWAESEGVGRGAVFSFTCQAKVPGSDPA